jgi:hypothetical protein
MYCIAVSTSLPKEFLKTADAVVDRLNKVAELIRI